jgi:branched-chain amino acid transport system permease protein
MRLPRWTPYAILLACAAAGFGMGTYYLKVAIEVLIAILFALSYNVALGFGGMVSFGHALFFGMGAYTVAIVLRDTGLGFLVAVPVATALAGLAGILLGLITLRTREVYFSMLTLGLSQLGFVLVYEWYGFTGGDNGIFGFATDALRDDPRHYFWFTIVMVALAMFVLQRIVESPFGLALRATREHAHRSRFLGLRPDVTRTVALGVSAAGSGLAGALYTGLAGMVYPNLLHWSWSAKPLIMALIGGMHSFAGPAVGAIVLKFLEVFLGRYVERWMLVVGAILLVVSLVAPSGLIGLTMPRRLIPGRGKGKPLAVRPEPL